MNKSTLVIFSAQLKLPPPYTSYKTATDIRIPAGKPPLRLKPIKTKEEARPHLNGWCHNIRIHFLDKGQWLSNEALSYFLQYEYEIDTKKHIAGCKIINEQPDIQRT